ncbi:hypothetical protein J7337_013255 [Fusarium musae]|uniref:Uncharacterized protein n=1 Tax=Fusarium musae TaxID=1042133 RepID=A0A9P8D467_9HYPO|nr:hypothetical protein J7337_013255 [Fusarium musae]KAG9495026.1 hypothetical protein J7337_013255 [Fusarium musae]RBR21210.1 hypothetical protein FVER53590_29008 [Fusarium verticillioides]
MTKNQILFSVDNQTPFTLVPNPTTFSDWGDFAAGPTSVSFPTKKPRTSMLKGIKVKPFQKGDGGHVMSSQSPFVGSAGIVGYSFTSKNGATVYIRLLASNPYLSVRDNWACVSFASFDQGINQDAYNHHYYNEPRHASMEFEGRTLKVSIRQRDLDGRLILM